jgi:predicted O-methyltransferase YrrM
MDAKILFEITETPTKIIEVDKPTQIYKNVTDMHRETNIKLYELIDNDDSEVKYIFNKFLNPVDTKWFSGKYATELLFIPDELIRMRYSHIFLKSNFMQLKDDNYGKLLVDRIKQENGLPINWIITEYEAGSTKFKLLKNPIITKDHLIQESNRPKEIKKTDYIHCGVLPNIIKDPKLADKSIVFLSNMHILKNILPKYLNINGRALFTPLSYSTMFEQDYQFMYILKLVFDKVVLIRNGHSIGIGFKGVPDEVLKIEDYVRTNVDITSLGKFILHNIKNLDIKWKTYLINRDFTNYFKFIHKIYLENKKFLNFKIHVIDNDINLFSIRKVQKDPKNISKYLTAGINEEEGTFLYDLILKHSCKKIIEIGMANGISAAYITSALKHQKDGILISIDPFQSTQWKSTGLELLRDIETKSYHKLIEKKSLEALPELLKRNAGMIDMVFVDGWHTFDYTLVDIFFAVFLLKIGGILVIDDALHPGVKNTLEYLDTNYTMLRRITSPRSFGAYLKFKDDTRDWNFHKKF